MEMFEKLMEKQAEYEAGHEKVKDERIFKWFKEEGLEILKYYCDLTSELKYEIAENGITVVITTKELLMLPDGERWLMDVVSKAGAVYIKPISEGKMEIKLWFRGWKWIEK